MDSKENAMIPLNVGNLALLGVLVTVTTLLLVMVTRWVRVKLWPGRRVQLHCGSCHQLMAVQLAIPPANLGMAGLTWPASQAENAIVRRRSFRKRRSDTTMPIQQQQTKVRIVEGKAVITPAITPAMAAAALSAPASANAVSPIFPKVS